MNAIVTGSTKGIGNAVALGLCKEGWNVAISGRDENEVMALQQDLRMSYPHQECLADVVDFYDLASGRRYAERVLSTWKQIHLLVNNAGLFFPGSVHTEEEGILEKTLQLNLIAPYHFTRAILPRMIEQRSGHIINICSIASLISYPNGGAYTISKFALLGFSKALREEMKPHGIKVTSVMPGATWTNSWKGAPFPEERLMQAADVAEIILSTTRLGPSSVVEDIVIRPQEGDL